MRTKIKKALISLCVTIMSVVVVIVAPLSVVAANVNVKAGRSDIYNQLLEATEINVVTNTLIKCIPSVATWMSPQAVLDEQIFAGGKLVDTALWVEATVAGTEEKGVLDKLISGQLLEELVRGHSLDGDGAIYCSNNAGGENILQLFRRLTGINLIDIVCQRGYGDYAFAGLLAGYKDGHAAACSNFDTNDYYMHSGLYNDDATAAKNYIRNTVYQNWYNEHKSENPYLPRPSEIGAFNNVDGYFNYILDFGVRCSADRVTYQGSGSDATYMYTKITEYEKRENTIVATNYYYKLTDNGSGLANDTWTYGLSSDNKVTSCQGLLNRISELQSTSNGIPVAGRTGGYENIILADLNDSCANAKTSDGANGWQELRDQLQEIVDDDLYTVTRLFLSGMCDSLFKELEAIDPESFAVTRYRLSRKNKAADKMIASVEGMLAERLTICSFAGARKLFQNPNRIHFPQLGEEKTALFLTISDMDRSIDRLINLLYVQAFQSLCNAADHSPGHRLKVPVRFYLDDFAVNFIIPDFDKITSVIRSRDICVSIVLQNISQLDAVFDRARASTILNNCDHFLYLGGTDVDTAHLVAQRANKPVSSILSMPLDAALLFTRGQVPQMVKKYDLRSHPLYTRLPEYQDQMGADTQPDADLELGA